MPTKKASLALPTPAPIAVDDTLIPALKVFKKAKPEVKKKNEDFTVIKDKDGDIFKDRIQINLDQIKHYIMCNDGGIVNHRHLVGRTTGQDRERTLAFSRFPVLALLNDAEGNWLEADIDDKRWVAFIKLLTDYKKKFEKVFDAVTVTDAISFHLLPMFVKIGEPLAVYKNNSDWICMKVTEARIRSSFFGLFFQVQGSVISYDGKEYQNSVINHSIYEYEGSKAFIDLGIKIPKLDSNLSTMLIERGKKYVSLHDGNPKYMVHTGTLVRKSYWRDHEYAANGRVMIDRLGMRGIDPNYEDYFGTNRYNDNDNETSVKPADFTDESYMCMSPYCYGFSFVAKQWGEMRIDNISEITFNHTAYDKLVLNDKTKDILFSLVDAPIAGKDLIEGKGGGCIFLLHGHPGLGRLATKIM